MSDNRAALLRRIADLEGDLKRLGEIMVHQARRLAELSEAEFQRETARKRSDGLGK